MCRIELGVYTHTIKYEITLNAAMLYYIMLNVTPHQIQSTSWGSWGSRGSFTAISQLQTQKNKRAGLYFHGGKHFGSFS